MRLYLEIQPLEPSDGFSICPRRESRSAVTLSQPHAPQVYGPSTKKHAHGAGDPSSAFLPVDLRSLRSWIRFGATDITYISLRRLPTCAVVDLFSDVLQLETSNSLDMEFCLEALTMLLPWSKHRSFHSDQGCQFTPVTCGRLKDRGDQDQLVW